MQLRRRVLLWAGAVMGAALLLLSAGVSAGALEANPFPTELTQADGRVITALGRGDEFFHWTEDEDGYVIAFDEDSGNWCYAELEDGGIVPGDITAGAQAPASALRAEDLTPLLERLPRSGDTPFGTDPSFELQASSEGMPLINITKTEQPLLVLLIEYNDQSFSTTYHFETVDPMAHWSDHFFGSGNSVNSYYKEVSGDLGFQYSKPAFTKTGTITTGLPGEVSSLKIQDGVARVKLNRAHPNTTTNGALIQADVSLAFDAAKLALDMGTLNRQRNGAALCEELNVIAVVAGYDASSSPVNPSKLVWAHANWAYEIADGRQHNYVVDQNNKLFSYAIHGELFETGFAMPIGASAHALGHLLGLPDLYSYIKNGEGIGGYSLMAGGSWGFSPTSNPQQGGVPTHLDALSKLRLGFATSAQLETVDAADYNRINLQSFDQSYNIVKITSAADPKQYFLLENRQLTGYDRGLSGMGARDGGIVIYHIDESVFEAYQADLAEVTAKTKEVPEGGAINDNNFHKGVDVENYSYGSFEKALLRSGAAFNAETASNSNFHAKGHAFNPKGEHKDCHPQTLLSGVEVRVNSDSKSVMEVDIGLSNSSDFVPVDDITGVTLTVNAGSELILKGTVEPFEATNKVIVWSVPAGNAVNAAITNGNVFKATKSGGVTIKATIAGGASPSEEHVQYFTITVVGDQELTPSIVYVDCWSEVLRALQNNASYSINGKTYASSATGDIPIDPAWIGSSLTIIKKGNGVTTFDSLPYSFSIPARPAAPTGLSTTAPTVSGNDGVINGTTTAMEYRKAGSSTWTTCGDGKTIAGPAGSYELRIKAKTQSFASSAVTVVIPTFTAISGSLSLKYRDTTNILPTLVPATGLSWKSSNPSAVSVNESTGVITSEKSFGKTPSATITAYSGSTPVATFEVSVKPDFGQWLLIILLFGWIWY